MAVDDQPSPYIYPAIWEHGVTDWFTLVWMPLPLEARFRIFDNADWSFSAGAAFLGFIQSRNRNFDWRPSIQLLGRRRLNAWFALDAEFLGTMEITRDGYGNPGFLGGLRLAPWFQVADRLGFSVGIMPQLESGAIRSRYVGALPPGNTGPESEGGLRYRLPLTFGLVWAPFDQWELQFDTWFHRIGYPNDFTSASMFLSVVHTW